MKRLLVFLVLFLGLGGAILAQPYSPYAYRVVPYGTQPSLCNPTTGDVFVKTGAGAGLYLCTSLNTWTFVGGSSS